MSKMMNLIKAKDPHLHKHMVRLVCGACGLCATILTVLSNIP